MVFHETIARYESHRTRMRLRTSAAPSSPCAGHSDSSELLCVLRDRISRSLRDSPTRSEDWRSLMLQGAQRDLQGHRLYHQFRPDQQDPDRFDDDVYLLHSHHHHGNIIWNERPSSRRAGRTAHVSGSLHHFFCYSCSSGRHGLRHVFRVPEVPLALSSDSRAVEHAVQTPQCTARALSRVLSLNQNRNRRAAAGLASDGQLPSMGPDQMLYNGQSKTRPAKFA